MKALLDNEVYLYAQLTNLKDAEMFFASFVTQIKSQFSVTDRYRSMDNEGCKKERRKHGQINGQLLTD